jgi:hypothetical protein
MVKKILPKAQPGTTVKAKPTFGTPKKKYGRNSKSLE